MAATKIAEVEDIAAGVMKKFDTGELEITVANIEGSFCAFEDRCLHTNSPFISGSWREGESCVRFTRHDSMSPPAKGPTI